MNDRKILTLCIIFVGVIFLFAVAMRIRSHVEDHQMNYDRQVRHDIAEHVYMKMVESRKRYGNFKIEDYDELRHAANEFVFEHSRKGTYMLIVDAINLYQYELPPHLEWNKR